MKRLLIAAVLLLPACRGPEGVQGRSGSPGQSIVGPQGTAGVNGADAVPVTVVPLCPGVSNYGAFVEVGLCLNGQLYGVYSALDGFLTLLAPGTYNSNAIGSACSLEVHAGCVVTH